jgi:hypothetical protein
MLRKLLVVSTTVFIIGGDQSTVSLQLTVLTGVFIGALLLQVRRLGLACTHPAAFFALPRRPTGGGQRRRLREDRDHTATADICFAEEHSFPRVLQTIFRPYDRRILFRQDVGAEKFLEESLAGSYSHAPPPDMRRLEVLGLSGCALTVYAASYFFNTIGAWTVRPFSNGLTSPLFISTDDEHLLRTHARSFSRRAGQDGPRSGSDSLQRGVGVLFHRADLPRGRSCDAGLGRGAPLLALIVGGPGQDDSVRTMSAQE